MRVPHSWDELFQALEALEWKLELESSTEGSLYITWDDYDFDWGDQKWYFEEPPAGIVSDTLLTFRWELTGAPISYDGCIMSTTLLQKEPDTAYVAITLEDITQEDVKNSDGKYTMFLAKITPGDAAAMYREFIIRELCGDFTGEALGRPPTTLINWRPDLIDQATVRVAMRNQLDFEYAEYFRETWVELADELNMADVAGGSSDLDDWVKDAILDRYFEQCYSEVEIIGYH